MKPVFEMAKVLNRHDHMCAMQDTATAFEHPCMDAPEWLPAGAMEASRSVLFSGTQMVIQREA